jgi:regulatory protein spx
MIDERRFQVGYNVEEIRVFIPRELRRLGECEDLENCPHFTGGELSGMQLKEHYLKDHKNPIS